MSPLILSKIEQTACVLWGKKKYAGFTHCSEDWWLDLTYLLDYTSRRNIHIFYKCHLKPLDVFECDQGWLTLDFASPYF